MTDHDLKELELLAAAKRDDETVSIEAGKLRRLLRSAADAIPLQEKVNMYRGRLLAIEHVDDD